MPYLTVRETLRFAAALRLPASVSEEQKALIVEQTIMELGLKDAADTLVGGPFRKGISGGEKRRWVLRSSQRVLKDLELTLTLLQAIDWMYPGDLASSVGIRRAHDGIGFLLCFPASRDPLSSRETWTFCHSLHPPASFPSFPSGSCSIILTPSSKPFPDTSLSLPSSPKSRFSPAGQSFTAGVPSTCSPISERKVTNLQCTRILLISWSTYALFHSACLESF